MVISDIVVQVAIDLRQGVLIAGILDSVVHGAPVPDDPPVQGLVLCHGEGVKICRIGLEALKHLPQVRLTVRLEHILHDHAVPIDVPSSVAVIGNNLSNADAISASSHRTKSLMGVVFTGLAVTSFPALAKVSVVSSETHILIPGAQFASRWTFYLLCSLQSLDLVVFASY